MMALDKKRWAANPAAELCPASGISLTSAGLVLAGFGHRRGDVYYGGALFIQRHPRVQFQSALGENSSSKYSSKLL